MSKKNWEEEFNKKFFDTTPLYSFIVDEEGDSYKDGLGKIKSFIKDLIKEKQKEAIKSVEVEEITTPDIRANGSLQAETYGFSFREEGHYCRGHNKAVSTLEYQKKQLIEELDE